MANKLQIAPVNTNNLLRWYPNTTPTVANSTFVTGIHNGYLYKWRTFSDYLPILTEDTLTLYTNFDTDAYLEGKEIKVVEESSCGSYTVINDATQYDITGESWGSRNAKITLTIPTTNIKTNHNFRLAIVGEADVIQYVSNYFTLFARTAKNINNTHLISFYNKSNVYNYEWSTFDETVDDFYQVRVASSMIEISYPSEKEIYQEATTGRPRVTRATNNKQITFEVYFNTEELHDGLSTVSNFRYFGVNGRKYIVESYEPSVSSNFNLFKSTMVLKDVEFDRRINICTT